MARKKKQKKIFVLDTSVILFDHNSINNFEENDVAIPITVLEELDNFKKGSDTKNFEAREFIRTLDRLSEQHLLQEWNNLNGPEKGRFKVIMEDQRGQTEADIIFGSNKNDHKILNAAIQLAEENPDYLVTMVSKDINLRLKAKAVGINAADYETGKITDLHHIKTGKNHVNDVPEEIIDRLFKAGSVPAEDLQFMDLVNNEYYILQGGGKSVLAVYNPIQQVMERVDKHSCYGINPRNAAVSYTHLTLPTIYSV